METQILLKPQNFTQRTKSQMSSTIFDFIRKVKYGMRIFLLESDILLDILTYRINEIQIFE